MCSRLTQRCWYRIFVYPAHLSPFVFLPVYLYSALPACHKLSSIRLSALSYTKRPYWPGTREVACVLQEKKRVLQERVKGSTAGRGT